MSQAYINSVKTNAPQAEIVFDRFHVQRLAHDALDHVRRALVAKHAEPEQRQVLKKPRIVLQKSPEKPSSADIVGSWSSETSLGAISEWLC